MAVTVKYNNSQNKACVISVSYATGCYRHIKISMNASFYILHQAILSAFEFDDDHAHAFFLSDNPFDDRTTLVCPELCEEMGSKSTKKVKLFQMLKSEKQEFIYLFDFGDEHLFKCRVLRFADETVDSPEVVRSKGEAPEQYPYYDDEDDYDDEFDDYDDDDFEDDDFYDEDDYENIDELRSLWDDDKLISAIENSGIKIDFHTRVLNMFEAANNFYGLVPLKKIFEIYDSYYSDIDKESFLKICEIASHCEKHYYILGEDEIHGGEAPEDPFDRFIVDEGLLETQEPGVYVAGEKLLYDSFIEMTDGKPWYTPSGEELLNYSEFGYIEENKYYRLLKKTIMSVLYFRSEEADGLIFEINGLIRSGYDDAYKVADIVSEVFSGMKVRNKGDIKALKNALTEFAIHVRTPFNHGFSQVEMDAEEDQSAKEQRGNIVKFNFNAD